MYDNIYTVIVGGGTGSRFGSSIPKQFADLDGKPVLQHTVEAFRQILPLKNITTVIHADWKNSWIKICKKNNFEPGNLVIGGVTRWESVKNGVLSIQTADKSSIVLVHDAARPLVSERIIKDVIEAVRQGYDSAVPVIKVTDSLRILDGNTSVPVERNIMRAVQTPQAFLLATLQEAFRLPYSTHFTDEATMIQEAGFGNIKLTDGDKRNLKITEPEDLGIARFYLGRNEES